MVMLVSIGYCLLVLNQSLRHGDIAVSTKPLFSKLRGEELWSAPIDTSRFTREGLMKFFTESEVDTFFDSEWYRRLPEVITSEDQLVYLSSDTEVVVASGVIRQPKRWLEEVDFVDGRIVYTGSSNQFEAALELFSSDADPLPQEAIAVSRGFINYSEFLPLLNLLADDMSTPEILLNSLREIARFPHGQESPAALYGRFSEKWTPNGVDIISPTLFKVTLNESGNDSTLILAWAALINCLVTYQFTIENVMECARRGMRPLQVIDMKANAPSADFEKMYLVWLHDIDKGLLDTLSISSDN